MKIKKVAVAEGGGEAKYDYSVGNTKETKYELYLKIEILLFSEQYFHKTDES